MDLLREIERLRGLMEAHPLAESFGVTFETLRALCDAAEKHLQPDLFEVPHQKKSETSAEAARKWLPKAKSNGMKVLVAVAAAPNGLIREEVCEAAGMLTQTATGRLNVLERARLIKAAGKREARSTGFNQKIYFIADRGRDFLAREMA